MKFISKIVFIIICVLIVFYIFYYFLLGGAIKKASNEASNWKKQELFQTSFSGIIHLKNIQNLHCQVFLEIIIFNEKQPISVSICPCEDTGFLNFVKSGDSIIKKENTFNATFFKHDGSIKEFKLPNCK